MLERCREGAFEQVARKASSGGGFSCASSKLWNRVPDLVSWGEAAYELVHASGWVSIFFSNVFGLGASLWYFLKLVPEQFKDSKLEKHFKMELVLCLDVEACAQ